MRRIRLVRSAGHRISERSKGGGRPRDAAHDAEGVSDRVGDAVVAVKDDRGGIKLNQLFQPVAQGAVSGMLWGSLIGLLFMMPLAGAAVGAASGALGGRLADLGINDDFMRQAARTLQSGNAALFLLIRKMTTDKVLAALRGAGGTVMRSSFDESKEEALRAALAGARAASAEGRG
jgi:uncharacterized membrane protein